MAGHKDNVPQGDLDEVVRAFVEEKVGKPAEVTQYRKAENTFSEVYCNGNVLRAKSNFQLVKKIYKMYDEGTLVNYFNRGFGFAVRERKST